MILLQIIISLYKNFYYPQEVCSKWYNVISIPLFCHCSLAPQSPLNIKSPAENYLQGFYNKTSRLLFSNTTSFLLILHVHIISV